MVMGGVSMGGMVATLTVMRDQAMWQAISRCTSFAQMHD